MLDVSREDIVDGPVTRGLVLLAAPLLAQHLIIVANQVVDTFWVGRLGEEAVAAVGVTFPLIALSYAFFIAVPNRGGNVLVAQRFGGGNERRAGQAAFTALTFGAAGGVVFGLGYVLFSRPLLSLLGLEPSVHDLATVYMSTYALGFPLVGASDTMEACFNGWGDTRASFRLTTVIVALNLVLDPVLIFGLGPIPGLGIGGAALATVLSYVGSVAAGAWMVAGPRDTLRIPRDVMVFDPAEYREMLDIGGPSGLQNAGRDVARVLMVFIVSAVAATPGLAAYNIGARIATLAFVPAFGLQSAAQSMIGQNFGAGRPERAGRTTWVGAAIGAAGLAVIGAGQWLVPGTLTTLFVPDITAAGFDLTVAYLQILAYGYWGIGAMYIFIAGFNGARRTRTSMVADYAKYWGVRLPVAAGGAYLLGMGVHAVFWGVTISNVVGAVGLGAYYLYETNRGMLERAADVATGAAD